MYLGYAIGLALGLLAVTRSTVKYKHQDYPAILHRPTASSTVGYSYLLIAWYNQVRLHSIEDIINRIIISKAKNNLGIRSSSCICKFITIISELQ